MERLQIRSTRPIPKDMPISDHELQMGDDSSTTDHNRSAVIPPIVSLLRIQPKKPVFIVGTQCDPAVKSAL